MIKSNKQKPTKAQHNLERYFLSEREFLSRKRIGWIAPAPVPIAEPLALAKKEMRKGLFSSLVVIVRALYTGPCYYYGSEGLLLDTSKAFQCGPQKLLSKFYGAEIFRGTAKRGTSGNVHLFTWMTHSLFFATLELSVLLCIGLSPLEIELVLRALGRSQSSMIFRLLQLGPEMLLRHRGNTSDLYYALRYMMLGAPETDSMTDALRLTLGSTVYYAGEGYIGRGNCKIPNEGVVAIADEFPLFDSRLELKVMQRLKLPISSIASAWAGFFKKRVASQFVGFYSVEYWMGVAVGALRRARDAKTDTDMVNALQMAQGIDPPKKDPFGDDLVSHKFPFGILKVGI